ncbi:MAG TPA: TolC family protein [Phycisphaerae bacterium]|nr:TolC family protein [Phycisphaerae bacterium]
MKRTRMLTTSALPILLVLAGCVHPGEMDDARIHRYRQALIARGGQPRQGEEGLGPLRPAPGQTGPPLKAEGIVEKKIIEYVETFRLLGEVGQRKRVERRETVKTTTFEVDPNTQQRVPRVSVEQGKPVVSILDDVPRDIREVVVYRVGAETGTVSMVSGTEKLVHLSLADAIMRALAHNMDIRVVSYDPAITREDMTRAAAVFDYTLYGGTNYAKQEQRSNTPFFGGDITRLRNWQLGVRQRTVTGADWSLEWNMTRTWDSSGFQRLFTTRYEPEVILQVTQPLLRNAWPEFNLAQLRVARLNTKISEADFRAKVEEVIAQVIVAYWTLIQARRELAIQQELLDQTRETYKRVYGRLELDATLATIKQALASVKIRQAVLIRARKNILDVQDQFARLLADAQINVLSKAEVLPTTPLVEAPLRVSPTEQLLTALRHSPLLEQARLAIAASEINVSVARNQALPKLDLIASTGANALDGRADRANDKLLRGDYVSYSLGLQLEYPIGNRDRLANLRARRMERTKAVVSMQNIADQIAVAIYERVRQIATTYEEMLAQRAAVEAARIQLQALEDTERIRAQLSPEFLRVKLQAQETLANSERAELQAVVDYNNALAELGRITGTILEMHRIEAAMDAAAQGDWPAAEQP